VAGVRLTHPDRVLYPDQGLTKLALARYYESIADWVLPHIQGRPLALLRCPEGVGKECFFQKHLSSREPPPGLIEVPIREKEKTGRYAVVVSLQGLIQLVQMGILEIHPWGAKATDVERPDRIVLDLDPAPDVSWDRVCEAALRVRATLTGAFGLDGYLKTTGGKGLHVVTKAPPGSSWDDVKELARQVAEDLARERPKEYTARMAKSARGGKIFIDYLRNARGATAVAPYSTRARAGAPVATPLAWEELTLGLKPQELNVTTVPVRLRALASDPWRDLLEDGGSTRRVDRRTRSGR
jgi:bifunctional non-homologous end joining protein LigD